MSARLTIAGLVLLCACAEAPTTSTGLANVLATVAPQAVSVDAAAVAATADAPRSGFYFRLPLAPEATYSGEFDATLLPYLTVEICRLSATDCTGPLVATFNGAPRKGAEPLRLDTALEQYIVNWDTPAKLDPIPNYRITVLAVGRPIGRVDVDVVASASQVKDVDASRFFPLVAGRTLPIRFRVEKGGFLVAGPAGGAASLAGGLVNLSVPAGALGAPVTLFADPVGDEPAESIGLIPGTVFDLTPEGTAFSKSVRLSIRYNEAALGGIPESGLTVLKKLGAVWVEADDAIIDAAANVVSVDVNGFSRWALGCKAVELALAPGTADLNLRHEETAQFSATPGCATESGPTRPVQRRLIRWSSSAPAIATADAGTGLVASVGLGQAGVTASLPRACGGQWPTVPPNASPCTPFTSSAAPVSVFRLVVHVSGAWQPNLRWLGASRVLVASVVREPDGLPVSQAVEWSSNNIAATVSAIPGSLNGRVTGAFAGSAVIIVSSALDPAANAFATVKVTDGIRLTAQNVVGDINGLWFSYDMTQHWDGMDYPSSFAGRGLGGHLQGIARVNAQYVLTHSRDDDRGLMIYGTNNNWTFTAPPGPNLGHHPGGIQASGDVVVVPHYNGDAASQKISFFRVTGTGFEELPSLRLTTPEIGQAAGIGYHPIEDRWYVVNGTAAEFGVGSQELYRTKPGLDLTDPANCFVDAAGECSQTPYKKFSAFASQGAMQVLWDEKSQRMALIALYRPDFLDGDPIVVNVHGIKGAWIDVSNPDFAAGTEVLSRENFAPTLNLLFSPTFRFASGVLLDKNGRLTVIATERCTSYEGIGGNPLPCAPLEKEVEYFILAPEP